MGPNDCYNKTKQKRQKKKINFGQKTKVKF